jgi:membrane protein
MNAQSIWSLLKDTYDEWDEDKAPRLAAALSYYTLFSLAPLLIIAIAVAGLVFGREAVQGQLFGQIRGFVGDVGAVAIEDMIKGASNQSTGIIAAVLGFGTLLLGAAGLFGQLQDALNTIWEVQPKPGLGIVETLKQRFFSFTMGLGTGFLLLVSLVISTALTAIFGYFQNLVPGIEFLWQIVTFLISFAITAGLFALMFKVIPDVDIAWRDVLLGAVVTALLFSIGRFGLAFYLGRGSFSSTYGAAGSLVIILLWVYYSAQILFFGAEFTQVYARKRGAQIKPSSHAVAITEQARKEEGMPRKEDQEKEAEKPRRPGPRPHPRLATSHATVSPGATRAGTIMAFFGFIMGMLIGRRQRSH